MASFRGDYLGARAHFDPRAYGDKPYAPAHNAQKLLGEIFEWYWNNREDARSKFDDFLVTLDVDDSITFDKGIRGARIMSRGKKNVK